LDILSIGSLVSMLSILSSGLLDLLLKRVGNRLVGAGWSTWQQCLPQELPKILFIGLSILWVNSSLGLVCGLWTGVTVAMIYGLGRIPPIGRLLSQLLGQSAALPIHRLGFQMGLALLLVVALGFNFVSVGMVGLGIWACRGWPSAGRIASGFGDWTPLGPRQYWIKTLVGLMLGKLWTVPIGLLGATQVINQTLTLGQLLSFWTLSIVLLLAACRLSLAGIDQRRAAQP
jgi:hypothetical protein